MTDSRNPLQEWQDNPRDLKLAPDETLLAEKIIFDHVEMYLYTVIQKKSAINNKSDFLLCQFQFTDDGFTRVSEKTILQGVAERADWSIEIADDGVYLAIIQYLGLGERGRPWWQVKVFSLTGDVLFQSAEGDFPNLSSIHPVSLRQFVVGHFQTVPQNHPLGTHYEYSLSVHDFSKAKAEAEAEAKSSKPQLMLQEGRYGLHKNGLQTASLGNGELFVNGKKIKASDIPGFDIPPIGGQYDRGFPKFLCQRIDGKAVQCNDSGIQFLLATEYSQTLMTREPRFAVPLPSGYVVTLEGAGDRGMEKQHLCLRNPDNLRIHYYVPAPAAEDKASDPRFAIVPRSASDWTGIACTSRGKVYGATPVLKTFFAVKKQFQQTEQLPELSELKLGAAQDYKDVGEVVKNIVREQAVAQVPKPLWSSPSQNILQVLINDLENPTSFPRHPDHACHTMLLQTVDKLKQLLREEKPSKQLFDERAKVLKEFILQLSLDDKYKKYLSESPVFRLFVPDGIMNCLTGDFDQQNEILAVYLNQLGSRFEAPAPRRP